MSRPYKDLVRPTMLTLCPSNVFNHYFNAQYILPVISKFSLQRFIRFYPRVIIILEMH